jgi:hypothetical protein
VFECGLDFGLRHTGYDITGSMHFGPACSLRLCGGLPLGVDCDAIRNLVQPTCYSLAFADGFGLANQNQKRGLEGVFGMLFVPKDSAAKVQDHWSMAPHENFKGCLILMLDKTLQELLVG